MNKIVRWYNQNKRIIWGVILIFAIAIALIQVLNNYYKNNANDESSSTNISTTTYDTKNYSIITEEEIDETTANQSNNLIEQFFSYCNNQETENAYNLLSSECKEELYPTLDDFVNKYYNTIFTEKKSYDYNLWITTNSANTYRVEIMNDLLATGKREDMPIEEYYTIVNENGNYGLSINGFVGKEDINISKEQNGINVEIVSKKMYIEYETYEIKVENNNNYNIIFNTKENTDSIYLEDENEVKYVAFLNEIPDNEFEILAGLSKTIEIRFNRSYKPTISIEKVVFSDIEIPNKEENDVIEVEI